MRQHLSVPDLIYIQEKSRRLQQIKAVHLTFSIVIISLVNLSESQICSHLDAILE